MKQIFIIALMLAGCVGASEIVPMGKDSYLVTGHATGGWNAGKGMIDATKQANAYCAKQQRYMIVRRTDNAGNAGFGGESSQLIFSCVTADDPEYARPNLRKDPTTVVEDARSH
jgi:hypothetical protein